MGNPKKKIELHREARRGKLENSQQKGTLSIDALLAFTAGQMIWRPKLDSEFDYVPLGLYQSIVRNSIPVYVTKSYYEKVVKEIFEASSNPNIIDVEVQGILIPIRGSFESQFTGQKELRPRNFKEGKTKPLYGIATLLCNWFFCVLLVRS